MDSRADSGAPAEHIERFPLYRAPRSDFDSALHALCNISMRVARDGRRKAILAALDFEATWGQVRGWRKGRRNAPQWAIDKLRAKIAARQNQLAHGANVLETNR